MIEATFVRGLKPTDARKFGPGTTVTEMVAEYNPVTGVWAVPVVCLVNNQPVLREDWEVALVDADVVLFVELPMGGGGGKSNPLQLLLTLALIAVANVAGGWVGGLLGSKLLGGVASGAIMALGGLLLGAIFRSPAIPLGHQNAALNEAASPTYGLNASNNQARLYQPIGEGFGRIKIVPDRVAQAYAKYSDNEFYLYQVFGLGRGSYQLHSLAYGDNVFWRDGEAVSGYEVEMGYYETGEPVTLFPDNVEASEEVSGQQVFAPNDEQYAGPMGPFSCNPPGTATGHVVCNVVFPQGLGRYKDNGGLSGLGVDLKIDLRRIDDFGEPLTDWVPYVQRSFYMATLTPQRFSIEIFPATGRWECRVDRTNQVPIDGRAMHACQWESMFSYIPGTLTYNQATLAVRTKATNLLSQSSASTFGVVYTRLLPEYDPHAKEWSEPRPTRKFVAAMSSVLRSKWGGNLPDRKIDLDALWGVIEPILAAKGWTFDGYFDGAYSVWSILMEMSQAFRVVPRLSQGGVSFVYDRPGRPIRHIFTPRDIIRGSLTISYNTFTEDTPDNILWNYLDEEAGYQQREVRCALPGTETENPVIKSFIGVVNRKQAFEMGVYQVACNRHRRIQLKFNSEGIGRLLFMGDACSLTHPYFCSLAYGGVRDWDKAALSIGLGDEPLVPMEGQDYYLSLDRPDGRPWGPCKLARVEGETATLDEPDYWTLVGQGHGDPFGFMDNGHRRGLATGWTLQQGKEYTGRLLIQSVVPTSAYSYEITAINDSEDVENYNDLPVPVWHYRGLDEGPVTSLEAPTDFEPRVSGDKLDPVMELFWKPALGADSYDLEESVGDTGEYYKVGVLRANYHKFSLSPGRTAIRARARTDGGVIGPWGDFVVDTQEFYGDPVDIEPTSFVGGNLGIAWDEPVGTSSPVDSYTVEIMDPGTRAIRRSHTLTKANGGKDFESRVYSYTKEMGLADGGLLRSYLVGVRYVTVSGTSQASHVTASDPPPVVDGDLAISMGQTSITLESLGVRGEHTGFVLARGSGPGFDLAGLVETRTTSALPYEWGGLEPGTEYYFRVAAKDAFADITAGYLDLEYTPAVTVTTSPAGDPGQGGE